MLLARDKEGEETVSPVQAICVVGPTGSGKSEVALRLAEDLGGEIVNFDSRQVYRDFPIVTDQPGPEKRRRAVHRLYGFLEPQEKVDAGSFAELARKEMERIAAQGRIPVLAGGTGLYLKAILYGLAPIPKTPPHLRSRILQEFDLQGAREMHSRLARIDPPAAAAYSPGDKQRISRALEVYEHTGKTLTWWQNSFVRTVPEHRVFKVGVCPERELLRLAQWKRIEEMIRKGALLEARQAWRICPQPEAPAWSGIGCRELLSYMRGELDWEQTKRQWKKRTWGYAKRQLTWFRGDREIHWFEPEKAQEIKETVSLWLHSAS